MYDIRKGSIFYKVFEGNEHLIKDIESEEKLKNICYPKLQERRVGAKLIDFLENLDIDNEDSIRFIRSKHLISKNRISILYKLMTDICTQAVVEYNFIRGKVSSEICIKGLSSFDDKYLYIFTKGIDTVEDLVSKLKDGSLVDRKSYYVVYKRVFLRYCSVAVRYGYVDSVEEFYNLVNKLCILHSNKSIELTYFEYKNIEESI